MSEDEPTSPEESGAPSATRHDLQLGRRLFHLSNGVATATGYALFFTHEQVIHVFGIIACVVYVGDRVRIAYPEAVTRHAPWVNRLFLRAEEQVRESAMIPFAIAVLLTILTMPKRAALIAIYALGVADPLAAVVGIRWGRRRITPTRTFEGSFAFFTATTSIAAVVLAWGFAGSPFTVAWAAGIIGVIAAICETLPVRIDDNLTIPLFVGFTTWIVAAAFSLPLS